MKAAGIWTQIILSSFVFGVGILILGTETGHAETLSRVRRQPPPPPPDTTTTTTTTTTPGPSIVPPPPAAVSCECSAYLAGTPQQAFCRSPANTNVQACNQGICNTVLLGTPVQLTSFNCGTLGSRQCAVGLSNCTFTVQSFLGPIPIPGTCQTLQNDPRVCGCAVLQSQLLLGASFASTQPFFQTPCQLTRPQ